jgi:integrase
MNPTTQLLPPSFKRVPGTPPGSRVLPGLRVFFGGSRIPKKARVQGSKTKYAISSDAALERLLQAARDQRPEAWEVVTILVRTGMHISILTKLSEANISGDVLWWERTKKEHQASNVGKICKVRIRDPDLKAALPPFLGRRRKTVDWYDELIKAAAKDAGMPEVSALSLRKTRVVHLRRAGLTPEMVARAIGATIDLVMEVYTLEAQDDLVDAVARADLVDE